MECIGKFQSPRWGKVTVWRTQYGEGQLAIQLTTNGESLATLSVNMYRPECSRDSKDLPPGCFYAKDWSENEHIAEEALGSGLFKVREDIPIATSGFVMAEAWEVL